MTAKIRHHNPAGSPPNPAFTHAVSVEGPVRTVFVGGQNAAGPEGVIGDDLGTQTAVALDNLTTALTAAGAELRHVVSWSMLVVGDADLRPAVAAFGQAWANAGPPPTITVARVAGLADPEFLVEITATAVVPL